MSLRAILRPNGRLYEMRDWTDEEAVGHPDLVPLKKLPEFVGPASYDSVNQVAIPATLTSEEKADRTTLPARVLAALVIEARPTVFTAAQRTKAAAILDAAAQRVRTILDS